jgi:hypothetical protein
MGATFRKWSGRPIRSSSFLARQVAADTRRGIWQTYFYDRKRKVFKEVDDFTGPIIKRNFKLSAPDWIEVQVHGTTSDPMDIANGHPEKRRLSALH